MDVILSDNLEYRFSIIETMLFPYQRVGSRRLIYAMHAHRKALDASDTGIGKTAMALSAAWVIDCKPLVVCPLAVIPSWKRMADLFGIDISVINYESLKSKNSSYVKEILIGKNKKGEDVFDTEWLHPLPEMVIFDECHRLKDPDTRNCQIGISAINSGIRVMGLSATSADNPTQMKFSALLTGLYDGDSFYPWMMRNGVSPSAMGMRFNNNLSILKSIHAKIFLGGRGNRIKARDLGDEFPKTRITAESYDMGDQVPDIKLAYAEMKEELRLLSIKEKRDHGDNSLTIQLRARQKIELLKVPSISKIARDAVSEGMSVVIFCNFDATVDAYLQKLKTDFCIRGNQNPAARKFFNDEFQAGRSKFIICNIRAGGVGIDLHDIIGDRPRLSLINPTFSGQDLMQCFGRVCRAGGKTLSLQRIVFAAGTVEENACNKVRAKIERIQVMNDGAANDIIEDMKHF